MVEDGTTSEQMDCEMIRNIFRTVAEGDELYINDRKRSIEVVERQRDRDSGHLQFTLSGYGTEYDLMIPLDGFVFVPIMRTPSGTEVEIETVHPVGEDPEEMVVSDTVVADVDWIDVD